MATDDKPRLSDSRQLSDSLPQLFYENDQAAAVMLGGKTSQEVQAFVSAAAANNRYGLDASMLSNNAAIQNAVRAAYEAKMRSYGYTEKQIADIDAAGGVVEYERQLAAEKEKEQKEHYEDYMGNDGMPREYKVRVRNRDGSYSYFKAHCDKDGRRKYSASNKDEFDKDAKDGKVVQDVTDTQFVQMKAKAAAEGLKAEVGEKSVEPTAQENAHLDQFRQKGPRGRFDE